MSARLTRFWLGVRTSLKHTINARNEADAPEVQHPDVKVNTTTAYARHFKSFHTISVLFFITFK